MSNHKELVVNAIKEGTVIDHIPAGNLFKVIQILGLNTLSNQMTYGDNLTSGRMGKKAIVKIAGKFFEPDEINRIALVAPHASLNIIKNYAVVEKVDVTLPSQVRGIVKCVNPKCITNNDKVTTKFDIVGSAPVQLRCIYCEKITDERHMEYIK